MDSSGKGIPDEQLVVMALGGDDRAYEELIGRYKRTVFAITARIAMDDLEVDEISQEIFVKAYDNLKSYRGDAPFGHWILRIAANTCRDILRKRKIRPTSVPFDKVEYGLADNRASDDTRDIDALHRAIGSLGVDDRLLITMLELEGKKIKEVAYILKISEGNVKVRAYRARKALKELFEKEADDE